MKYYTAVRGFTYYGEQQSGVMQWWGRDAERLNLHGEVKREDFIALCQNQNPATGETLTVRQKDNRRVLMDITIDIGKEASVIRELYGKEEIADAARRALYRTLEKIQDNTEVRVRKGGKQEDRLTGSAIFAIQEDRTARPVNGEPDALTHFHCLLFNASWDSSEQRYKAVQLGSIKRDSVYYQSVFNAEYAKELKALRYAPTNKKYGVGLDGVPKPVVDKNSNRRNQILKDAAAKNITSGNGKHAVGYKNRESKSQDFTMPELRERWAARLTPEEKAALDRVAGKEIERKTPVKTAEQSMEYAIEHEFERRSTMSEKRLQATALQYGLGDVDTHSVQTAYLMRQDLVRVRKDGEDRVTTRAMVEAERAMIDYARNGRGRYAPLGQNLQAIDGLKGEQREAALHILGSRDAVVGVRGGAGTGKTTLMRSTVEAIVTALKDRQSDRYNRVHAFAPSSQASRNVLRNEGFKDADTLESLLCKKQVQERVRNQVIWVDEAGMIPTEDMNRLFRVAKEQNTRIILTGDYYQHGSVKAGDAFRLLESQGGVKYAELKQNRRQKNVTHRKAVVELNKGTNAGVKKGWAMLEELGAVVEVKDDLHKAAVDYYLKAVDDKKTSLLIVPTHQEGGQITAQLREALRDRGVLGKREKAYMTRIGMDWTEAQKKDTRLYEEGMIVRFVKAVPAERVRIKGKTAKVGGFAPGEYALVMGHDEQGRVKLLRQNGGEAFLPEDYGKRFQVYWTQHMHVAKGERVRITQNSSLPSEARQMKQVSNGDIYTVTGFTEGGDMKLNNGLILPKDFGHFRYGYVDTSPSSQGKTVERAAAVFGEESLGAVNRQLALVGASRPKDELVILTADKEAARKAVMRSGVRESALELVEGGKKDSWHARLKERLERSRAVRYFREQSQRFRDMDRGRRYA